MCCPLVKLTEHKGGMFPSTSHDHEDVMWIGLGRMPQQSWYLLSSVLKDSVGPEASAIWKALLENDKNEYDSKCSFRMRRNS